MLLLTKNKTLTNRFVYSLCICFVLLIGCEKDELESGNTVTTSEISYIKETEAQSGGFVFNGGKTQVNSRGICWSNEPNPTIDNDKTIDGMGDGSFISLLTNLTPNTTYHVRAYASNEQGTSYGNNIFFTTRASEIPLLSTTALTDITSTSCKSGGIVIYEGSSTVISRGVCWSVTNSPTLSDAKTIDGTGIGEFSSYVNGLQPNTAYYLRAYATNEQGTGYGNLLYLKPLKTSVTDIEGNEYTTVVIGTQVWTVENLNVTKYRNGDDIENIQDGASWNTTEKGAYCDYENDELNSNTYGRLYNWYATIDARNLAPAGWHVATYEDYQVLIEYLGGPYEAEEKLINGGFKALAGGKRNRDGNFYDKEVFPYFWTSTEYHEGSKWARYIVLDGGELDIITLSKNYGFAVRLVRD